MEVLNLGIVAHVDAGKTSLTERLLFAAGVIGQVGSVDAGSTQTDSLALERRRGITIKAAVVSFRIGDLLVNLIDTPGHPDFIAEVERVLGVLDGAVLVVSAVEGVQAQTRVLARTLGRLRIPTLVFVNKLDRRGARDQELFGELAEKLSPAIIRMGRTSAIGTAQARFEPAALDARAAEVLAENDEKVLAAYVNDEAALTAGYLRQALADQTKQALVHPVYFGSAITGAGTSELTDGIRTLLPAARAEVDAPARGVVFKVERGAAGEKIPYLRMTSGALAVRDRVRYGRTGEVAKLTGIEVFGDPAARTVEAGRIARLWGLPGVRIGDAVTDADSNQSADLRSGAGSGHFAPPTLETVVSPVRPSQRGSLRVALGELAEQDPLIDVRQDDLRQEISVSLYGEVQKEVIQTTLAEEYGIEVGFRETTTICVERVNGVGEAVELIKQDGNPFLAGVGLRIEPAGPGDGVSFGLGIELGSLPLAFIKAVEETVRATLKEGLHGWEIPDCRVSLIRSQYWARQSHSHGTFDKSMSSTAGDFRNLTPLVLVTALQRAGTTVEEPLHRFRLETPTDTVRAVLATLTRLRAIPLVPALGAETSVLEGEIPAAAVHELEQYLPGLTRGEAVLESAFERYQPVTGLIPTRPRTDHNPLRRRDYLLHVVRRV